MESGFFTVSSPKNPVIKIQVTAGHFATSSSHVSHYIDVSEMKSSAGMAKDAARELAYPYLARTLVDIIVCMDGAEIISAYLADELLQDGTLVMNKGRKIHIVTPTPLKNASRQLIFHQNVQARIKNSNVLLVIASLSSGKTIRQAMECIAYYGGELVGISAIFSVAAEIDGHKIYSLFTYDDIPDYRFYSSSECALCKEGRKLDAIINSEGYTKL